MSMYEALETVHSKQCVKNGDPLILKYGLKNDMKNRNGALTVTVTAHYCIFCIDSRIVITT